MKNYYFAQMHKKHDGITSELLGSNGVVILDGRLSRDNQINQAIDYAKKLNKSWYHSDHVCGVTIHKGTFSNNTRLTKLINF